MKKACCFAPHGCGESGAACSQHSQTAHAKAASQEVPRESRWTRDWDRNAKSRAKTGNARCALRENGRICASLKLALRAIPATFRHWQRMVPPLHGAVAQHPVLPGKTRPSNFFLMELSLAQR
ncbi:hypothetical protein TcCL_NonESM08544 [Trypanosoma cruzi]|nr:hypothetical protein TcCL_NonESM08544 [Trypanosoma cruzi]